MGEKNGKKGVFGRLADAVRALVRKPSPAEPEVAPVPMPGPAAKPAKPAAPSFSLDHLARRLFHADDPIAALRDFADNAEKRLAGGKPVAPLEAFLAHALIDAGVDGNDVELPSVTIVRPRTSGLFYVRVNETEVPYLSLLRVLGIEAALNAACLASAGFGLEGPATEAEVWQFTHRVSASVTRQIEDTVILETPEDPKGEWFVRRWISSEIERYKLPWRLSARFRVNVSQGTAAFVCDLTPLRLMWRRTSIDGERVVPTTPEMQRRSATDYNARVAFLLAAAAFYSSERIERVWVAGTIDTAHHHSCLYSVCFDRERFLLLDLEEMRDPVGVLRFFGAAIDEQDDLLQPIQQTFSLDDARFCPPERFDAPETSARILPERFAAALGTSSVAGLGIDESGRRDALAREISRRLGDSTAANVATIMEVAGDDPDPSVRAAAERTVRKLIDGTITEDVFDITREFTEGDELSAAVAQARLLLQSREVDAAESLLAATLAPLESVYADSPTVVWRVFLTYVDRVLYNRSGIDAGKTVLLAPSAYLEGLLMHSMCLMMLERSEEALAVARRAQTLCPTASQTQLHTVQCLEACDRTLEAVDELRTMLAGAHDPMGIGFAYYRMAYFQWQLGEIRCAQACYLRAIRYMPSVLTLVAPELQVMAIQGENRLEDISDEAIDKLLAENGIPVAPTREVWSVFFEAMQASLDAEIFPVAKNFLLMLGALSRDDVYFGVLRSLEDEPDR